MLSRLRNRRRPWRLKAAGLFLVLPLAARAQQLPASAIDLAPKPASTQATAQAPSEPPDVNVYKSMSLQQLMEQQVTSVSRTPEPLLEAPAAIQIVTNEEIRRSGASSLPEALRLADNLDVAQTSSDTWNISARGFNANLGNKLLVMVDGRTIYSPLFSGVFWDVQNVMLADLDRIEVVSGPGGTLWGANAVNGVINIISKSAQDTQGWYMDGGGGSQPRDFGELRYGGKLAPDVYFRVYGTYYDRNNEMYASGAPAADQSSQGKGGFRMDTAFQGDDNFTLQGDYYNGREENPDPAAPGVVVNGGENVIGRWNHDFSSDSALSLQAYFDKADYSRPTAGVGDFPAFFEVPGRFQDSLDTYDIDLQHHFQADEANKITWGAGYRFTHDQNNNSPTLGFVPAPLEQNVLSTFVQDEARLAKDVYLTYGTKVEHNDYTGFEVEPSGRIQWNFLPTQMVWAAVSRAVRTPSRVDHDLIEPTGFPAGFPQNVIAGTTQFTSETLIAYEVGYRAQIGPNVSGSLSTFYNDYSKIRSVSPTPGGFLTLPLLVQNNLEGSTYGFELSTDYQVFDWWRLHAGYDFLHENIHVRPGEVDFTHGLNETADPENQLFVRSSMDLPQNIELDADFRWIDQLTVNSGATAGIVPDYAELQVRAAWHPTKNIEISVVGQNLLHNSHPEYGFPGPNQILIERSVYGKIVWHF